MRTKMKYWRRRTVALIVVFVVAWVGANAPAFAPPAVTPFERLFIDAQNTVPTTTTVPEVDNQLSTPQGFCPDVVEAAKSLGWQNEDLGELDYVAWRESRCLPYVHFPDDPHGGSHGIMQVNGYWCLPSRYSERGWLQDRQMLGSCSDLYNPIINLLSAHAIFVYSAVYNGNGWQPWGMPKDFCESSTLSDKCHVSWGGKGGQ